MKRLASLLLLLAATGAAQNVTGSGVCASALVATGTCQIPNPNGVLHFSVEEIPSGSPSGVSVTVKGCMRSGTCGSPQDTNTSTSAVIDYVTADKVYDYFVVTVGTLSGGTSPKMAVNYRLGAN